MAKAILEISEVSMVRMLGRKNYDGWLKETGDETRRYIEHAICNVERRKRCEATRLWALGVEG
jgi:hypothetical protein